MKNVTTVMIFFFFFIILLNFCNCYKNPRFISLTTESKKDLSENLGELHKINDQLVTNEREDEDDDDDEELTNSSFDDIASESLQDAEKEAVVDLENIEIENLLNEEIFRVIQERLKMLWYIGKCRRDYTLICPLEWKTSAYNPTHCIPPETYEGPLIFKNK
ncbi:CPW-WPC family protein [Hepatocystis sp. ex Piliocolobus tephrosceles]|nr:CPW-WPC family protein [Hepatocystis sp. ex Piliocolobus tephrosceles]